ncbi:MAG: hypothetical protein MJK18_13435, partial [Bdellovibrionales bacterium]|nr:hypothetical protein [Bdellovibrionales bacterium]
TLISRQGAMIQFENEEPIHLFWRWYWGGDLTFARYEASGSVLVTPIDRMPWQLYAGTGWQFGARKNFEVYIGAGASSEFYMRSEGTNQYSFEQTNSLRAHLGFYWRFLSIIGSSAVLNFRYSRPVTTVEHGSSGDLEYAGVLDGTLRLRPYYDSTLSLYGGIRFEDYNTEGDAITYFTTRLYAGVGIHF